MPQSKLVQKTQTKQLFTRDILEILNQWKSVEAVQQFKVKQPHAKKPITYWRATQILKENPTL